MEKVRLGDVFSFIRNGASIKQGLDDSGYPITRIETISDRTVNREKMGYAGITDVSKYDDYILQDGDILMSHINSEKHLGKTAIYKKQDEEKIIHGMNLLCLRPEKSVILPEYAFYFLSSVAFLRQIPNITKKSVNQASFTVTALKELSFAKCNIDEQKKIIDEFDKVTSLIDIRKMQLESLDEIVKARFVELFGDPEKNTLCWREQPLSEHLNVIGGYAFKSEQFSEEGIPVLRIGNINAGFFKPVNLVYWEDDDALNRYKMYPGDLVMSLTGTVGKDDYGNVCILGNDYDVYYLNQRNAKLELQDTINKYYLSTLLKFEPIKKKLTCISRGVRQANISNKDILNLSVPIPPIELQNQFAAFFEQTDKSKFEIKQSLEKLELLKKALMQKYFG